MTGWLNGASALLALLVASLAGINWGPAEERQGPVPLSGAASLNRAHMKDGRPALVDASGALVPIEQYKRIVSGSTISDALLLELASPHHIIAFSRYSETSPLGPHRFEGKPHINALDNLEELLTLKPDLLLLSTHGDPAKVARLRQAGLRIFNLGEMRGLSTYLDNALAVAALLGAPERGPAYVHEFQRSMLQVATDLPKIAPLTAIYLVIFSGKIFGGGKNTSYDDVLTHAGLINTAATTYEGWPQYDAEEILQLDPQIIVTRENMGRVICQHPGLHRLQSCRLPNKTVVELPAPMISDAGAGMLPAAARLREAVYGPMASEAYN